MTTDDPSNPFGIPQPDPVPAPAPAPTPAERDIICQAAAATHYGSFVTVSVIDTANQGHLLYARYGDPKHPSPDTMFLFVNNFCIMDRMARCIPVPNALSSTGGYASVGHRLRFWIDQNDQIIRATYADGP